MRLISATNLTPKHLADADRFRQDLFYRINTVEITLPALRERREDIPLLLEHFVALYAQKYNFPHKRVSASALDELMAHTWPGNVRALRHAVERTYTLSEGSILEVDDFSLAPERPASSCRGSHDVSRLDDIERDAIARALAESDGNVSRAAAGLGLTRASFYRRKMKYGL